MRFAVLLAIVCAGCVPVTGARVPPGSDGRLLVLLFEDARSIERQLATDFACVSLRQGSADQDPPAAVVDELANRWKVPVIPGSRCSVSGDGDAVAAPGATGTGKWLRVANLQCRDANHCTADASYYVANMGSGGRSLAIERIASGWRLTPSGAMWIS